MARFTALQRVRLKRNIYQAARDADMREAFATGQTGFVSRVPPNNEHIQHDDNCIYYIYLDSGFDRIIPTYQIQADGWYVMGDEIEDIDEQARLEAVAAEMRRVSDEYWDVVQATAHPAVAPPPAFTPSAILEQLANVPVMEMPQPGTRTRFAPRFTPQVGMYDGVQMTGAWLDEQSDRVDHARDAAAYMQTTWAVNPLDASRDSDSVQEG